MKGMPAITSEAEATHVAKLMLKHEYFHRSQKGADKGYLEMSRDQTFDPAGYYTWLYLGSQTLSHLMTALIIIGLLVVTCFPIWPQFLKICMWYLSVTLLIFMLTFLTLRAIIWLAVWVCGYEFWILPRLFDESLNFCESFVPVWSWEPVLGGQGYYRVTVFIGFIAFGIWAWSQPTDFDSFLAAQKDFVADLYEGNLLSDTSQESRENIDKPRMQSLEDILKSLDEEEEEPEESGDDMIDKLLDSELDDDELDAMDERESQAEADSSSSEHQDSSHHDARKAEL